MPPPISTISERVADAAAISRRPLTSSQESKLLRILAKRIEIGGPVPLEALRFLGDHPEKMDFLARLIEYGYLEPVAIPNHEKPAYDIVDRSGSVSGSDAEGNQNPIVVRTLLRIALARYGRHLRSCAVSRWSHWVECDCGLNPSRKI